MKPPDYEVFAVRYATAERKGADNFLVHDAHDGAMPLDFFFWVVRGAGKVFVVDTGFSEYSSRKRNRTLLCSPAQGLGVLGLLPQQVGDVVLTHLHYDHAVTRDSTGNSCPLRV